MSKGARFAMLAFVAAFAALPAAPAKVVTFPHTSALNVRLTLVAAGEV